LLFIISITNKPLIMHSKVRLFFALCAMFSFVFLQAQDRDEAATPISKGSIIIGGAVSFASQGGDLYANGDDRQNTLSFMPNALFFVADNIAVGGQLNFTRAWQGDVSSTQFGIGPTAGYFLDVDSSIYPYGAVGLSYQNLSIDSNFADESHQWVSISHWSRYSNTNQASGYYSRAGFCGRQLLTRRWGFYFR
jgi:hypothetical protein